MINACDKCRKMGAFVILLIGIAFLLVDLGVWNFWNLSWWTVVFLFMGLAHVGMNYCPECQALRKKKK